MQDLKKNFKNIQFQNMFFNHITEFDGQDGLKEWVDNALCGHKKVMQKARKNANSFLKIGSKIKSRNPVQKQLS